jgi:hypothetical protein
MAESKVIYTPRADATSEMELSALVAAYRFIIFDCRHVTEKGVQRGAPDAAKETENGCDATRIVPR